LVAASRHRLAAFGYPVNRGRTQDKLRVCVQRYARCRSRNRSSALIVLGDMAVGALIPTMSQSYVWQKIDAPSRLLLSREAVWSSATATGLVVLGFVAALAGVVLHCRLAGFHALGTYSPVVMLWQAGWHYPTARPVVRRVNTESADTMKSSVHHNDTRHHPGASPAGTATQLS
jgi:hypothetical protein